MELLLFYILQFACDLSGIRKPYPCGLVNPKKIESLECNPAAYTWHCIVQETIGPLGLALILILIAGSGNLFLGGLPTIDSHLAPMLVSRPNLPAPACFA